MEISVYTKNDFTDKSILEFLKKDNISINRYSQFLLEKKLNNPLAVDIIKFICIYDNGFFKPDKCDAHEPIREKFLETDLTKPIRWLSQPGGAFYFKQSKGSKIEGVIENHRFAPIWEKGVLMKPKVNEPLYLGEIRFFFDNKIFLMKGNDYWVNVLKEICELVGLSFGYLASEKVIVNSNIKEFEMDSNKQNVLIKYNSK